MDETKKKKVLYDLFCCRSHLWTNSDVPILAIYSFICVACRCVALSLLSRYMLTLSSLNVWCLNECATFWVNSETNGKTMLHYGCLSNFVAENDNDAVIYIYMYPSNTHTHRFCDVQNRVVSNVSIYSVYTSLYNWTTQMFERKMVYKSFLVTMIQYIVSHIFTIEIKW